MKRDAPPLIVADEGGNPTIVARIGVLISSTFVLILSLSLLSMSSNTKRLGCLSRLERLLGGVLLILNGRMCPRIRLWRNVS